jgi:uncharacterized membrane protein (UPF0127 family)
MERIGAIFRLLRWCILGLTATAIAQGAGGANPLPTVPLSINGHKLVVEVAATPDQRATGLMNRFSLQPDHGMVFVFERPEPQGFWMRNTFIPLSIAFIAPDGRIINVDDMAPHDERTHVSRAPALYAIEMRRGWFTERSIGAGDVVKGLPEPKR